MSNTDFAVAIEDPDGLLRRLQGHRQPDPYIGKNELRVIIGPNGAGKTTLLDLICSRTKASSGSIKFRNEELTGLDEHIACAAASAASSRRPRSTRTSPSSRTSRSVPAGRSVLRPGFKRTDEVKARAQVVAEEIGWRRPGDGIGLLARSEAVAGDRDAADAGARATGCSTSPLPG